jgi:hypothetical protein
LIIWLLQNCTVLCFQLVTEKDSLLDMLRKQSSEVSELQVRLWTLCHFSSQLWSITHVQLCDTCCFKNIQALNSELSKKLELQTQRFELAVTQNMASEAHIDPVNLNEEPEVYYVDEGDEVSFCMFLLCMTIRRYNVKICVQLFKGICDCNVYSYYCDFVPLYLCQLSCYFCVNRLQNSTNYRKFVRIPWLFMIFGPPLFSPEFPV